MYSDELAEYAVIADDGPRLFSAELEILRNSADDGGGEDMAVIAENDIIVNIGKGVNSDIFADLSLWAHIC